MLLSAKQKSMKTNSIAQLALLASLAKPLAVPGVLFILPPTSLVLHVPCLTTCLTSACESVPADITVPINPSQMKQLEATAHHQKFFGAFLYGVLTNGAQLYNAR